MKTTLKQYFAAGLLGASLFGGGLMPAIAAAPKAGSGTAVSAKAVVAPGQVKKEDVRITDTNEITQLNSLQIQSIYGNTVTAAQMQKVWCIRAPCPMMPAKLFTINVSPSTILLFRNRTRATLTDFAVGEKINVYGFIDGANMDALIMRDLDKPQFPVKTELHNMQIIGIGGNTLTVQYHFDCKGQICPMGGVATSINGNSSDKMLPITPMIYPMASTVTVDANTKFSDRNGNSISFGDLKVGDILDIWGTTNGSIPNSTIQAQTIRDNSIPVKSSGNLSIQSLTGPGKLILGQSGEWKIQVTGGDQSAISYSISWGDEPGNMGMIPEYQNKQEFSFGSFTHVYQNPGSYTVRITVTDAQGSSATATASVYVYSPIMY